MCSKESKIFPGHGPVGKSSSVLDKAIVALEFVSKYRLLEKNEEECSVDWRCQGRDITNLNPLDMCWVEWDPFLQSSIVQYDEFSFAKLKIEHEH